MQDNIFELPNGNFLLVPTSIIGTLHQYRQLKLATKEQGGMLMGVARAEKNQKFTIEDPPCIEIISITEPCKYDIATRTSFKRQCNHHLIDIKRAAAKNGNLVYLGEWHTHPQDNPVPSNIDLESWRKAFKNTMAIVAIVGRVNDWWGFWAGNKVLSIEKI
jgi:integrative and conjugative element protein (TIGR02256 family)